MTELQLSKLSPELRVKLTQAAQDAIQVQNACNFSGVEHSYHDILRSTLWPVAHELSQGTGWIARHPVTRLFLYKLNALAGRECLCATCGEDYDSAFGDAVKLGKVSDLPFPFCHVMTVLGERGIEASYEYPGYIRTTSRAGNPISWGTDNGTWTGQVMTPSLDAVITAIDSAIPADSIDADSIGDLIAANSEVAK